MVEFAVNVYQVQLLSPHKGQRFSIRESNPGLRRERAKSLPLDQWRSALDNTQVVSQQE